MTSPPEQKEAERLRLLAPALRNANFFYFSIGQVKIFNLLKERLDSLSTLTLHTENLKVNN
jgi:hypothetical protein